MGNKTISKVHTRFLNLNEGSKSAMIFSKTRFLTRISALPDACQKDLKISICIRVRISHAYLILKNGLVPDNKYQTFFILRIYES